MLYKVALTFASETIHMKSISVEQYFPEVLFIMLYRVVLNQILSVNKILKCDLSNRKLLAY